MKADLAKYFKSAPFILVSSPANIEYLTGYNGFSHTERECFLLLSPSKKYLITDGRYAEAATKYVKEFEVIDTGAGRFVNQKSEITKQIKKIGVEEYNLSVSEYRSLKKIIKNIVAVDLSAIRMIKNSDEITKIKKACKISDDLFDYILEKLKVGVSEKEVCAEIELFYKKHNVEISFSPIVAFGANSSVPHHTSDNTKLKNNSIVLLDFGAKVEGYCSDMSRTVYFGKADPEFRKMYTAVLEAQKLSISKIKTGVRASNVDKAARKYLKNNKYPNIPHSVGHGIGLQVHEAPHVSINSKEKIRENMVFSVEPGAYLQGFGGVRIEDLILVRNGKPQLISRARRNIIEV